VAQSARNRTERRRGAWPGVWIDVFAKKSEVDKIRSDLESQGVQFWPESDSEETI
jgi:hypothetical protein